MTKQLKTIWLIVAAGLLATLPAQAEVPPGTRADMFVESGNAVLVETFSDREVILPGEEFTLAARIVPFHNDEISFHIYGAEPSEDWSYVPSAAAMYPADDVEWSEFTFPPGEQHDTQLWLTGQPVIHVTGKLAEDAEPGPRTFAGQFMVAACTEEMCLAPSQIELSWEAEIATADTAGEREILSVEELVAPREIDYSQFSVPEPAGLVGGGLDLQSEQQAEAAGGAAGGGELDLGNLDIDSGTDWPLWKLLIFALLGGLILNVMPCVLPVVSIKVIDLVKGIEQDPRTMINHGLIFAAGIILTFLAGALAIVGIQAAGQKLGWGFQFQNPAFLIVMMGIVFIFGLSLADVFKFKAPQTVTGGSEGLAEQEGYIGSFFKGVLATLLGTPCVGPFLGYALIAAFTLGAFYTLMIFLFVGIGMALPYVILLPFVARMGRRERGQFSRKLQNAKEGLTLFKHFMSFLLFGTVVWLLWTLAGVMGAYAMVWVIALLTTFALAAWLYGRLVEIPRLGLLWAILSAVVLIGGSTWLFVPRAYNAMAMMRAEREQLEERIASLTEALASGDEYVKLADAMAGHEGWLTFSVDKLKQYTAENKPVLVDFTADWCPNCKWNEKTALNIESTMQLKEELGFVFLYADWTTRNDEIGDVLEKLGFLSVPLTAIFPAGNPNSPILLDGVYTPTRLHEAMRRAAPAGGKFELGEGQDVQESQVDQAVEEAVDLAQLERPDLFLESRYAVLVDAIQDRTQMHPGEEFILAARLIPFENEQFFFHVYGAEPSPDWSYVPSVAKMDPAEGVAWGEFVFPPGEDRESQMWLTGQPVIYVSGKLADDAEPGEREFTAQIMFSACTEEMCLAPSQIELSWKVEVLAADAPASTPALSLAQLMAPVDVDINRYMLPETGDNLGAGLDLDADADQS